MNARQRRRLFTAMLVAANVLLAALIAHTWLADGRMRESDVIGSGSEAAVPDIAVATPDAPLGPAERYASVTQRPLFDAARRPPAPTAVAADSTAGRAPAPPDYTLDGIVFAADRRAALLTDKTSSRTLRVTEGTQLGAWTLKTLDDDRAVFQHRQAEHEILLWKFMQPAAAPAAKTAKAVRRNGAPHAPHTTSQER